MSDNYTPEFTTPTADKYLHDPLSKWILEKAKSDPRTYDKLVRAIRKKGIGIEDRPIGGVTGDRAIVGPILGKRSDSDTAIIRSPESRNRKLTWVLAHEYGHIESTRKPFPRLVFGLSPWLSYGGSGVNIIGRLAGSRGLKTTGAVMAGAGALGTFMREMSASLKAKKILKEMTGEDLSMPSELRRAMLAAGAGAIPAVASMILTLAGK